jgi:hypothetical protein
MDETTATTAAAPATGTIAASDITPETKLVTADHPALATLGNILSDVPEVIAFLESQFSHFRMARAQRIKSAAEPAAK